MNTLAIRNEVVEDPRAALAEWRAMREQAEVLVQSRFLPQDVNTAEKAVAIIMTGRELGIPPMMAMRQIHIIKGKPTLSAQLMSALVLRNLPGAVLQVVETTDQRCIVEAKRPEYTKPSRFVWTMEDAKRAGLTSNDNWRKFPRDMLRSRCISEACRAVFPDVSNGIYTSEELDPAYNAEGERVTPTVVDTKPAEKAPEETPEWVRELQAAYGAAANDDQLAEVAKSTKAQIDERGATDAERGDLNRAYLAARNRIKSAKAKLPEAPPTEPDDDSADPEAREAEADGYREGFE